MRLWGSVAGMAVSGMVAASALAVVPNGYYVKDVETDTFYDIAAQRRGVVHDGAFTAADGWSFESVYARKLYKFDRRDAYMAVALAYDATHFYVALEVQDDIVLDQAAGAAFETFRGDAIEIYIDPDLSRDANLQGQSQCSGDGGCSGAQPIGTTFGCDYVLAFTANLNHYRFDTGNNGGTQWAGVCDGTVLGWIRTSVDVPAAPNRFWRAEVAIPWARLGFGSAPAHGTLIGLNVLVRERDDPAFNEPEAFYDESRWNEPFELHRFYKLSGDGLQGPANYMRVYLVDPADSDAPEHIDDLAVESTSSWSGTLTFTAPGDAPGVGYCERYAIRTSGSTIDGEGAWSAAREYPNSFRPRKVGGAERLEILGLSPGTTHHVAVRCVDHAGNLGPVSNPVSIPTSSAPGSPHERGFARASSIGGHLVWQNGEPIAGVGDHLAVSWRFFNTAWNFGIFNPADPSGTTNWRTCNSPPELCGLGVLEDHVADTLRDNGVNVMRLFFEDLGVAGVTPPLLANGLPYLEYPAITSGDTHFHPAALDFLDEFLRIAKENDVYVILVPFDTFYYVSRPEYFPYATFIGADPNRIFNYAPGDTGAADARQAMKNRLSVIANWALPSAGGLAVKDHPNILYIDILNEWDGSDFSTLEPDDPNRLRFLEELLDHARTAFPNHLLAASTVEWQPIDAKADLLMNGAGPDLIDIHGYTKANRDPKATGSGDTEFTARGSLELNQMVRYYQGNAVSPRPISVSEFAHIEEFQAAYDPQWTELVDVQQMRNLSWTILASGGAHPGLRIPGPALALEGPALPAEMRDTQASLRRFIDLSGIDFARFGGVNWDHRLSVAATNQTVWAFGSFAGPVGLVYLMQDLRVAGGTVADAVLTVRGLEPHEGVELPIVFWDPGDASQPPTSGSAVVSGGRVDIMVPGFQRGTVVSVPEPAPSAGGLAAIAALLMLRSMRRPRRGAGRAARPSDPPA